MSYLWRYDQNDIDWAELSHLYEIAPLGENPPDHLAVIFTNSRFKCFIYDDRKLIGVGRALADGRDCVILSQEMDIVAFKAH